MPPVRLTGQERRAAIIDSAIELFAEKGFRGVTTRELAHSVGVSEPVLYQHFPSKRELYDAIMETIAETSKAPWGDHMLPRTANGRGNREFFTTIADALIRWYQAHPAYVRLFLFAALERNEFGELFISRHSAAFLQALADYIRRQIAAGTIRELDPVLAAHHFIALVAHYGVDSALCDKAHFQVQREDAVASIVDIFLKGVQS